MFVFCKTSKVEDAISKTDLAQPFPLQTFCQLQSQWFKEDEMYKITQTFTVLFMHDHIPVVAVLLRGISCTINHHSDDARLTPCIKNKSSFTLKVTHAQPTTLFPLYNQEIRKKKRPKDLTAIFDNICEPQMALEVITFCWTTITASISHSQRQRVRERDVFILAVVWSTGLSKMCTNQLAWLTLEMACQHVNLEQRGLGGNSYGSLTVKGGQMSRTEEVMGRCY